MMTRKLPRPVLSTIAGISVAATVLVLVALPSASTPKKTLHLPSGKAANAAFISGLTSSTSSTKVSSAMSSSAVAIAIKNYAYVPASPTVSVGTTVTWTNEDTAPHTVTVSSGPVKFASPTLQKGDTYTFTFTTPGTYSYYCAVHPTMTATVIVTGSASTSTPTSTSTASTPTPTPTSTSTTMPMPSGDTECAVSSALQTFLSHVNSAHLSESPGQQVQDILDLDSYIGNHLVLVERMLSPLTDGGLSSALSSLLSTFLTHVNSAHLDESPGQQVQDILDVNSYIGNHLVLVQHMLEGTEGLAC